mmetsp:Transcript_81804/g.227806  ORF Transcript_81804/g.227806 Transcript_81804/m.227806 type:complete len:231 (-) Transcript_81804:1262-1954(-)
MLVLAPNVQGLIWRQRNNASGKRKAGNLCTVRVDALKDNRRRKRGRRATTGTTPSRTRCGSGRSVHDCWVCPAACHRSVRTELHLQDEENAVCVRKAAKAYLRTRPHMHHVLCAWHRLAVDEERVTAKLPQRKGRATCQIQHQLEMRSGNARNTFALDNQGLEEFWLVLSTYRCAEWLGDAMRAQRKGQSPLRLRKRSEVQAVGVHAFKHQLRGRRMVVELLCTNRRIRL